MLVRLAARAGLKPKVKLAASDKPTAQALDAGSMRAN
jgi:hypothetical protein